MYVGQSATCLLITLQSLSGGNMNKVLLFRLVDDEVMNEAVVFKIYGNVRDDMATGSGDIPEILSREAELIGMQVGHLFGVGELED